MIDAATPIDVVVADDHELVRAAIIAHVEATGRIRCVGEAGVGEAAVALVERLQPAIALVDVGLPDIDGFEVARRIVASGSPTRVVLVSGRISTELVEQGFDAGASGYVSKVSSVDQLPDAIDAVLSGARYVDPEVAADLVRPVASLLDATELQVLEHMTAGRDDDAIALRLRIDVRDVVAHVDSVLGKLDCATRTDAVEHAIRQAMAE